MEQLVFFGELEIGFRRKSPKGCLVGVIGAVDGCIIGQKKPPLGDMGVENPMDYWCERKKVGAVHGSTRKKTCLWNSPHGRSCPINTMMFRG